MDGGIVLFNDCVFARCKGSGWFCRPPMADFPCVVESWKGLWWDCRVPSISVRNTSLPKAGVCQWPHANGVRSEATHGVQRGVGIHQKQKSPPHGGRMNDVRISQ